MSVDTPPVATDECGFSALRDNVNLRQSSDAANLPPRLDALLAFGLRGDEVWTPTELEAAFAEQVSAAIEFDLSGLGPTEVRGLRARAGAHGLLLKSLRELLLHPQPPLELLVMAKEYFKANSSRPQPGLPAEVARSLYYLTLAAGWLRHKCRISSLSDQEILAAMEWVRQQDWISADLQQLAAAAAQEWPAASENVSEER